MGIPVCSDVLSSSPAIDALNRVSIPSVPKGTAIPVPGVLIGNSSSGMGIGAEILPGTKSEMNLYCNHLK